MIQTVLSLFLLIQIYTKFLYELIKFDWKPIS